VIVAATVGEIEAPTDSSAPRNPQLFAVGAVSDSLVQMAIQSGGIAYEADRAQLVGAFDAIAADVSGRYRLLVPVAPDAGTLAIAVRAPEGTGMASVSLRSPSAKNASTGVQPNLADDAVSAARSARGGSGNGFPTEVAVLVGCVVLVGAVLGGVWARRTPAPATAASAPAAAASASAASLATASAAVASLAVALPTAPGSTTTALAPPLPGFPITALCDEQEVAALRAAVSWSGAVVAQAQTADEALRDVVTGRARALFLDATMPESRTLAAVMRQRNDAGWSVCPTIVHAPRVSQFDSSIAQLADVLIRGPIEGARLVEALESRLAPNALDLDRRSPA
jgi:hypothetical protein